MIDEQELRYSLISLILPTAFGVDDAITTTEILMDYIINGPRLKEKEESK